MLGFRRVARVFIMTAAGLVLVVVGYMYWPVDVPDVPPEMVRDGDIVLIQTRSLRGTLVRALGTRSGSAFSHIGILAHVDGQLQVVHACPDAERVVVEPLRCVLVDARACGYAICRPTVAPSRAQAALARALAYARRRTPFDDAFDTADAREVYCTELVLRTYGPDATQLGLPAPRGIITPNDFAGNRHFPVVWSWL